MKLPAFFVLFGLLVAAISALANDTLNPQSLLTTDMAADPAAQLDSQDLPKGIDRRPGIVDGWEERAQIFSIEDLEKLPATD